MIIEGVSALNVDWLQQALLPPHRPIAMQAAELAYESARADRQAASKVAGRVVLRDFNSEVGRPGRIAERFIAELAEHDAKVNAARVALETQRAKHKQEYLMQAGPTMIATEHALGAIIDLLDTVVCALATAKADAESNELPVPALMSEAPRLRALTQEMRIVVATGGATSEPYLSASSR
jgi:hypothetical protein